MNWLNIDSAPKDGSAFLAFGIHNTDYIPYWYNGDYWWAIILWDIWRGGEKWVFSKDGSDVWSEPLFYCKLLPPKEIYSINNN